MRVTMSLSLLVLKLFVASPLILIFSIFSGPSFETLEVRPDLPFEDISALLVGIVRLSLSCYPDRYENVDKLLGFVLEKVEQLKDTTEAHSSETITNILELLKLLIRSFPRILTVLRLKTLSHC